MPDENIKEFPRLPKAAPSMPGSAKAANSKTKTTGILTQSTYITQKSWAKIASGFPREALPPRLPPPSTHLALAIAAAERKIV